MAANPFHHSLGRLFLAACLTVTCLLAAEHHGVVKSGGLPLPGVTVTAVQGDKKVVTSTDDKGAYEFPELADGVWTISVEMLGFEKVTREIGVAPDAPGPLWDMKMMTLEAITAPPAPTPATTTPAATTAAAAKPAETKPAETKAAEKPAETKPAAAAPATASAKAPAKGNSKTKGAPATAAAGNNGNPSLAAALGGRTSAAVGGGRGGQGGFQRMGGSAGTDASAAAPPDMGMSPDMSADLSAASNDSFMVNGSVSRGMEMAGPGGDWGPGGGGRGDMGGGFPGMGMNGDPSQMGGNPGLPGADAGGGAGGGRGGRGGGGPGGGPGGGGPGGFGGGGGRGGGGLAIPMSPGGGRGGRGGGRGGPGGPGGRGGMNSFGNNRRTGRSRYNFTVNTTLSNAFLNARQYSFNGQSLDKPNSQSLRGGITAGGPLKIPHLLSGEHTTFNVSYNLTRGRLGTAAQGLMPTLAQRNGNLAGLLDGNGNPITVRDPTTGNPFPNNQLTFIDPTAKALLAYYPQPNFTSSSQYNYGESGSGANNSDNLNVRISHTINAKNQVNGNVQYQRGNTFSTPNLFGFTSNSSNNGLNASASYIYHFTLHTIATTRYNFSRAVQDGSGYFAGITNIEGQLGILGVDQSPLNWGPPSLRFQTSNISGLTDRAQSFSFPRTSALNETVLWVHGKHEFTFGGDYRRQETNLVQQSNPRGSYTFTGAATGSDLADFLLGIPTTTALATGNPDKYYRSSVYDLSATDQWRLTTNLSVSLSFRWDYQAPTTEKYNRLATLDVAPGFVADAVVTAGQAGTLSGIHYPESLLQPQKTNFSPRVGIAWKPFPKHSTLVRAGFGSYYSTGVYQGIASSMGQQPPLSNTFNITNTCGANLINGFSIPTLTSLGCIAKNTATNTFAIDPNYQIGLTEIWQLSLQQNLRYGIVSTVTYNGIRTTGLPQMILPWTTPPGGSKICPSGSINGIADTCPSGYTYETSKGSSFYNSFSGNLNKRSRGGLSAGMNFVFNKSTDNATTAQDWTNLGAERARSAGIRAETLGFNMSYSTGVGARGGGLLTGWKGVVFRGWNFTTNINLSSGAPISIISGKSLGGGAGSSTTVRAFYWGGPAFVDGILNPAVFTAPPTGQWGNLGRDSLTGPSTFTMSANASRSFRVAERKNLTFTLNTQNPLNHFVVTSWYTTLGSAQFGQPNGYTGARTVTATMRFSF